MLFPANLLASTGKNMEKPDTTKATIHQEQRYYNTNLNTKKLKPNLVTYYDIWLEMEKALFFTQGSHLSSGYTQNESPAGSTRCDQCMFWSLSLRANMLILVN